MPDQTPEESPIAEARAFRRRVTVAPMAVLTPRFNR
jgi:hypothetical protein